MNHYTSRDNINFFIPPGYFPYDVINGKIVLDNDYLNKNYDDIKLLPLYDEYSIKHFYQTGNISYIKPIKDILHTKKNSNDNFFDNAYHKIFVQMYGGINDEELLEYAHEINNKEKNNIDEID